MRLISRKTFFFHGFNYPDRVPGVYVILSHRWAKPEHEVSYNEYVDLLKPKDDLEQPGERLAERLKDPRKLDRDELVVFDKIVRSCFLAKKDGIRYVWMDTCCIEEGYVTETTAAIDSMFTR